MVRIEYGKKQPPEEKTGTDGNFTINNVVVGDVWDGSWKGVQTYPLTVDGSSPALLLSKDSGNQASYFIGRSGTGSIILRPQADNTGASVNVTTAGITLPGAVVSGSISTGSIAATGNLSVNRITSSENIYADSGRVRSKVIGAFGTDPKVVLYHAGVGEVSMTVEAGGELSVTTTEASTALGTIRVGTPYKDEHVVQRGWANTVYAIKGSPNTFTGTQTINGALHGQYIGGADLVVQGTSTAGTTYNSTIWNDKNQKINFRYLSTGGFVGLRTQEIEADGQIQINNRLGINLHYPNNAVINLSSLWYGGRYVAQVRGGWNPDAALAPLRIAQGAYGDEAVRRDQLDGKADAHGHPYSPSGQVSIIHHSFGTVDAGASKDQNFSRTDDQYAIITVNHPSTYIFAVVSNYYHNGFTVEVRNSTQGTQHTNVTVVIALVKSG